MMTLLLALLVSVVALGFAVLALVLADRALVADEQRRGDFAARVVAAEAREARRAADRTLRIALGQPEGEPRPDGSAVLAHWRG